VDFTGAGVTSQAILSDLILISGLQYYATVRGTNYL